MSWYLLLILRFKTEIALVEERKKRCLTFAVSYCCVPTSWDILEVPSSYLKAKCKYHSTDTRLPNQTVPACSVNPCSGVYLNAISQSTFAFSPDMGRLLSLALWIRLLPRLWQGGGKLLILYIYSLKRFWERRFWYVCTHYDSLDSSEM